MPRAPKPLQMSQAAGCELGDRPAAAITTRDVEQVLGTVAAPRPRLVTDAEGHSQAVEGRVAPRTVNQHRQPMSAIFNYKMQPSLASAIWSCGRRRSR